MGRYTVMPAAELPSGERKIVELDGRSIGIFNVGGRYHALRNLCPHQGGPVCLGRTSGLITASAPGRYQYSRDGEIVRCPWHGWEFDITTGRSVCEPEEWRLRTYPVTVEPPSLETYPVSVEADWIVVHV